MLRTWSVLPARLPPCSARQALRHPYFRDLREAEKRQKALMTPEVTGLAPPMQAVGLGHAMTATTTSQHTQDTDSKSVRHQVCVHGCDRGLSWHLDNTLSTR
jgi:hypothetical protein